MTYGARPLYSPPHHTPLPILSRKSLDMSEDQRSDDAVRWGRPNRKKSKGPQPTPAGGGAPAVGPIDDPIDPGNAGMIVRAPASNGSSPVTHHREPEAEDLKLRDLMVHVARGLVDRPDDVSVDFLSVTASETSLELRVHPDDIGHVIGKLGRTARSMRLTLGAAAQRMGRRANLEIAD